MLQDPGGKCIACSDMSKKTVNHPYLELKADTLHHFPNYKTFVLFINKSFLWQNTSQHGICLEPKKLNPYDSNI